MCSHRSHPPHRNLALSLAAIAISVILFINEVILADNEVQQNLADTQLDNCIVVAVVVAIAIAVAWAWQANSRQLERCVQTKSLSYGLKAL